MDESIGIAYRPDDYPDPVNPKAAKAASRKRIKWDAEHGRLTGPIEYLRSSRCLAIMVGACQLLEDDCARWLDLRQELRSKP